MYSKKSGAGLEFHRMGYGGLILSGLVAYGLEMWAARKKGTGVYLYNSKRSRREPDTWAPPAPKQFERAKPYTVINSGN